MASIADLTYDPDSGVMSWITDGPRRKTGQEVGGIRHDGRYRTVVLDGCRLYVHRVAWALMNGPIPADKVIDHIDGNGLNNRLSNLRLVSRSLNQRNRKRTANSTTGVDGVHRHKNGFVAHCGGEYITWTKDFFEACCVRKSAELRMGYHPNHGR